MKRGLISAFRSEVWLLARHPATALMIALAAVLYVVAAATSSEVLIMVAGDDPYMLGGVPIVLSTGKCSPCDRIAAC